VNKRNLAVIDVETSGTSPLVHDLLSVAIVPVASRSSPLVVHVRHEDIVWTPFARANFEHFGADWERSSVHPIEAIAAIEEYLFSAFDEHPVIAVGHNVGFDLSFLKRVALQAKREAIANLSHRAVDTHSLLYVLYLQGRLPKDALTSDGAFHHFGIEIPSGLRHTALADAIATRTLFDCLLSELGSGSLIAAQARWR
jgi:DNA polymerase III subunit epsilon